MENFLSNNVLFEDTDDAITFINNVKREPHKFNILDFVDEPVSHEELLVYLLNHKKQGQILDQTIIKEFVDALDIETTTRIYYKNQILKLLENSYFKTKLNKMLQFAYTDKIAPEMEEDLEDLKAKLMEFCLYDYLIEDRYKRSMKDKRKSIITIDTDSNFINIDKYITTITDSLILDKTNKTQQLTLLNIFINITTEALKRTFWTLTTNMNLVDEAKPLINMKQESIWLLYTVMYIANSFNCWNRKESASKLSNMK